MMITKMPSRFGQRILWPLAIILFVIVIGSLALTIYFRQPVPAEVALEKLLDIMQKRGGYDEVHALLGKQEYHSIFTGHGDMTHWYSRSDTWHFTRAHTVLNFEVAWITAYYNGNNKLTYCRIEKRTVSGRNAWEYY